METDGCVIKLLDTFFRSCAHDSCRWYQDYRNEKRKKVIRSTKKQLLGLAVVATLGMLSKYNTL